MIAPLLCALLSTTTLSPAEPGVAGANTGVARAADDVTPWEQRATSALIASGGALGGLVVGAAVWGAFAALPYAVGDSAPAALLVWSVIWITPLMPALAAAGAGLAVLASRSDATGDQAAGVGLVGCSTYAAPFLCLSPLVCLASPLSSGCGFLQAVRVGPMSGERVVEAVENNPGATAARGTMAGAFGGVLVGALGGAMAALIFAPGFDGPDLFSVLVGTSIGAGIGLFVGTITGAAIGGALVDDPRG
jgi:hypothetical protein